MTTHPSRPEGLNGFPKRLALLLKQRNYSHRGLADALGVSKQSVTNWTQGHNEPSLRHLREIARVLDLPLGELLEETEGGGSPQDAVASEILRDLTSQPVGQAIRSLAAATPDLFDLLSRAERYVADHDR
jgi:transcriptional regulator with XRE-family HTH domain